ncbi:MAG: amidohydrolase family protein [Xanthobacteraceae bacterium]
MALDLILRNSRIGHEGELVDIGIADGRIVQIAPGISGDGQSEDVAGKLIIAGFVEAHIHLDKSCILDRCQIRHGTLAEAVAEVSVAKLAFEEDDIYRRAQYTLEKAILHGTTRMRTHVEVDPRIGLKGFDAIRRLKQDYAWAIDLEICVFPQEGLLNDPGAEALLIEACEQGADTVGGCPYTDSDPHGQIAQIFTIAQRFDRDIDFHLDFDLDPSWMDLEEVCRQTERAGWGGRVAIGHVTKLSALGPQRLAATAKTLADAGVAVTVLPATDLYLTGRDRDRDVPRGVAPAHRLVDFGITCSIASNNILNPFTPFGDCSLLRMANLYANVTQAGRRQELLACFEMITTLPAKLMNLRNYGVSVGNPADLIALDCANPVDAVAMIARPLFGIKRGRRTFICPPPSLLRNDGGMI